jgi:uncharacterized membrane protein
VQVKAAVTVKGSPDEVYAFWHDFEKFPTFMGHLESVQSTGGGRSHWKAKAPAGKTVEWDAEVTEDQPGERIAWRSLEGADVDNSGVVRFAPAPGDRGTEVRLEMAYEQPGGPLGKVVSKLFGEEPKQQVNDALRRFKQVYETGEVVRSDGSPEGHAAGRQLKQRPAHPLEEPVGAGAGNGRAS